MQSGTWDLCICVCMLGDLVSRFPQESGLCRLAFVEPSWRYVAPLASLTAGPSVGQLCPLVERGRSRPGLISLRAQES